MATVAHRAKEMRSKRAVQVKRAERTSVVDARTSHDPAKAARIANAIAQAYLAEQTEVQVRRGPAESRSRLSARLN